MIDYEFEAREAPAVYLFGDILMKCQVAIVREDGQTLPRREALVTLVNNSSHSLFSSLIVRINNNESSKHLSDFQYKSFFQNLLSFNSAAKVTNLFGSGWSQDTQWIVDEKVYPPKPAEQIPVTYHQYTSVEPNPDNAGFMERVGWFKNNFELDSRATYRSSGWIFVSPLMHDFHGCPKPLMPGSKLYFSFRRARHEFSIVKANLISQNDPVKYSAKLLDMMLYVKVGYLALPLWKEIKTRFAREDIKYFFRGLQIKVTKEGMAFDKKCFEPESAAWRNHINI